MTLLLMMMMMMMIVYMIMILTLMMTKNLENLRETSRNVTENWRTAKRAAF
jgi:hypothetical protein